MPYHNSSIQPENSMDDISEILGLLTANVDNRNGYLQVQYPHAMPSTTPRIPRHLHYVFISTYEKKYSFDWLKLLSLKSAMYYIKPDLVTIHVTELEPEGIYWDEVKHKVSIRRWEHLTHIDGKKLQYVEHLSDYIRVCAVHEEGGIYLDWDCIVVNDVTPLLYFDTVFCEQSCALPQICLAAFMSAPGTPFMHEFLKHYHGDFRESAWIYNSQIVPHLLATKGRIAPKPLILPPPAFGFYWPVASRKVPGAADNFANTYLIHQYFSMQPQFWTEILDRKSVV